MEIIAHFAGISFGEADIYRRLFEKVAKGKADIDGPEMTAFKEKLYTGATKRGYDQGLADQAVELIMDSVGYAFNKCLAGDEYIYRGRNNHGALTIEEMFKIKNDKSYAIQTGHLALHKKYKHGGYGTALSMYDDGRLRPNRIVDIYYSGKRDVYLVTTEDGSSVRCTLNHSFPTPNGKKTLSELQVGDMLYVLEGYEPQVYQKLNTVRHRNTPTIGQRGFQDGGPIGTWIFEKYRKSKLGTTCELCPKYGQELHHKDHNKDNNVCKNFMWLCNSCHKKIHYSAGRTKRYEKGLLTKTSPIISITHVDCQNVYDVEMEAPHHNLLMANGLVVSNSHSVCYSLLGYWTAYFKANYPLVFYTVMLNGNEDLVPLFLQEIRRKSLKVLPPHINYSNIGFEIEADDTIRTGLGSIKGLGPAATAKLIAQRPFESWNDILQRSGINKNIIDILIKANSLMDLGIQLDPGDNLPKLGTVGNYFFPNRAQQRYLWNCYVEVLNKPKSASYLVPENALKGWVLDKYDLVFEKTGGVVIPDSYLELLGLNADDFPKTRCHPKGTFAAVKVKAFDGGDPLHYLTLQHQASLAMLVEDALTLYLEELQEFGFTFTAHPTERLMTGRPTYQDVPDGYDITLSGIVVEINQRMTKTKKPFYNVMLRTPTEVVKLTLWNELAIKYKKLLQPYSILKVSGTKGYGGITVQHLDYARLDRDMETTT